MLRSSLNFARARTRALRPVVLLSLLSACAGSRAFGTSFPINRPSDLNAALSQARAHPRAAQRSVVVGVTANPSAVFAYDIAAQRLLWKIQAPVSGVPVAAGPFVVVPEGANVSVRELDSGAVIHQLPAGGLNLIGADSDGQVTAIVLSSGGSMGARSRIVLLNGRAISYSDTIDRPLGGPAVLGGLAFVPHNRVHLSVIDVLGKELARVRIRDDVASQAMVRDGEVFFGWQGLYRLDEHSGDGLEKGASYYRIKRPEALPGQPGFLPDSTVPPPAPDSAVHRVSLGFAPSFENGKLGLADDTLYLLFYRQLFALAPQGPGARWVFQTQSDVVGMKAVPGGAIVVDDQGQLSELDAAGSVRQTGNLGVHPIVARIRAEHLDPGTTSNTLNPLSMQLFDAALNPDNRLVPSRVLAVQLLAGLDDADATNGLIEVCQDRAGPERVRRVACLSLGKRTIGSEAVIAALSRHADYLTDAKGPPVGPLAEAAMHSKDAHAVPALISQLQDPETSLDDLPPLMMALKELADPSIAEPIADFLRLYHADADDSRMADALVLAVETLGKVSGSHAADVLEPIANDALGAAPVRGAAARVLAGLVKTEEPAKEPATETPAATPEPTPVVEGPPARLTSAHVERALAPLREKLSQCVRSDPKRPMSARVTIVVEGDGKVTLVQTLPESLKPCVEPLVKSATFPATTWGKRDTLSTTITR